MPRVTRAESHCDALSRSIRHPTVRRWRRPTVAAWTARRSWLGQRHRACCPVCVWLQVRVCRRTRGHRQRFRDCSGAKSQLMNPPRLVRLGPRSMPSHGDVSCSAGMLFTACDSAQRVCPLPPETRGEELGKLRQQQQANDAVAGACLVRKP